MIDISALGEVGNLGIAMAVCHQDTSVLFLPTSMFLSGRNKCMQSWSWLERYAFIPSKHCSPRRTFLRGRVVPIDHCMLDKHRESSKLSWFKYSDGKPWPFSCRCVLLWFFASLTVMKAGSGGANFQVLVGLDLRRAPPIFRIPFYR